MTNDDELLAAQQEWDAVASVTMATKDVCQSTSTNQGDHLMVVPSSLLSSSVALQHFRDHRSLSFYKHNIKPAVQYTGLQSCIRKLFGPPQLLTELEVDRDLILSLALWQFDNDDSVHTQMIRTIYRQLTSSTVDPPRFGNHWDDIGFQGTDPATDLRGGGCASLINLLYLTNTPRLKNLSQSIYTLSKHPTQNFPFSIMSINITRIALHALREQLLNKLANSTSDLITVFNNFYVACFFHLYLIWRDGGKTIHDSGYVMQETENYCCKHVSVVIKNLETYLQSMSRASTENTETVNAFTNLDAFSE
ncbi:ELMOD3 [Bugula neritina]|uniref:ELMOD3 n=1 Tax=Bugula neritina TaxID=10212 RepID=A0A7J7IYH3_BUGNE|nr:ELMOD3 [Bugula neritina]